MSLLELPEARPSTGLQVLELEITGKCQLACAHCFSESGPHASHGTMRPRDWRKVIIEAAALGIPRLQLIGGEPTVHPQWREFADLALSLDREVEIFSNLFHVREEWWHLFTREGVTLATSYYSDSPVEHDTITQREGSYFRTRSNIRSALARGVQLRAGVVDVLPGQRVREARQELEAMGVAHITTDRVRAVGRAALPGQKRSLSEMCGKCTRGRAAVLPTGDLAGCVLSRDFPVGNVRTHRLGELLGGEAWSTLAARIPVPTPSMDCNPDQDGEDCAPAETEACEPSYE